MTEKILRACMECGNDITITLDDDGTILEGGKYFGEIEIPVHDTGEWRDKGTTQIGDEEFSLTEWTGESKEVEYWECPECSND